MGASDFLSLSIYVYKERILHLSREGREGNREVVVSAVPLSSFHSLRRDTKKATSALL